MRTSILRGVLEMYRVAVNLANAVIDLTYRDRQSKVCMLYAALWSIALGPHHCGSERRRKWQTEGMLLLASSADPRTVFAPYEDIQFLDPTPLPEAQQVVVAGCSNVLPILWCSIFTPTEVHRVDFIEGEDDVSMYVAVTPLRTAASRALQNADSFVAVFPQAVVGHIWEEWLAIFESLAALNLPYLHWDLRDLTELYSDTDHVLQSCFGPFAEKTNADWEVLLAQADLEFDTRTGRCTGFAGHRGALKRIAATGEVEVGWDGVSEVLLGLA